MRLFTIVGVVLTVIGLGLAVMACGPREPGLGSAIGGMAAGIAALTLLPMGILFTLIGVWTQRLVGARGQLIEDGIPGQATILSVGGGNVVVNNIKVLLTFRLRVTLPGRSPYDVRHRQLMSMFSMAALQVGATVPVVVDATNPNRLTIDVTAEAGDAARRARPVADIQAVGPAQPIQPNTLATMGAIAPNTISADRPEQAAAPAAVGASAELDLRPDTLASVLANGILSTAFIRSMTDTGVNVLGESLVRLTLDVRGPDGDTYRVETASLVPDAARSRALPGATIPVRADRDAPGNVVVDWAALST